MEEAGAEERPINMPATDTASPSPAGPSQSQWQDYQKEVHQAAAAEEAQAQQIVSTADAAGQQQVDLAQQFASTQQPFNQPPPQDQIKQVMSGAPWLFAMTAMGGKLSGANGLAMLQGLNGMSDGLVKGDQQALDNSYKNYEASFDKWKANTDQQYRIYKELAEAYAGANDGKLRALMAAQKITGDVTQMKLSVDDPSTYWTMKAKIEEAHAKVIEARAKASESGSFGGKVAELMAALAEKGVSLPAGLRSKQQQRALYEGLIARNPDKSVDEIADLVKAGKIEMGAETKETQTAAAVAGRVSVAQNEIKEFAPLIRQASTAVPRGQFVPITKLMQMGDTQLSDPNLKRLKIAVNSLLNAYDLLAARGGTDKDKRAAAHALITSADSPEALEAGLQQFELEAQAAGRAASEAMKPPGTGPAPERRIVVSVGTSQSTGKTYVKYSDGSVEQLGGNP